MPVVFITRCGDVSRTVRAMRAGAVDFICKPFDEREVVRAVVRAIERSKALRRRQAGWRDLRARYESLTSRERQVLGGVVSGRLNKQIAGDLAISEITVKKYRGRVMEKMKATRVAGLVEMAVELRASDAYRRSPEAGEFEERRRVVDAVGDGAARHSIAGERRA